MPPAPVVRAGVEAVVVAAVVCVRTVSVAAVIRGLVNACVVEGAIPLVTLAIMVTTHTEAKPDVAKHPTDAKLEKPDDEDETTVTATSGGARHSRHVFVEALLHLHAISHIAGNGAPRQKARMLKDNGPVRARACDGSAVDGEGSLVDLADAQRLRQAQGVARGALLQGVTWGESLVRMAALVAMAGVFGVLGVAFIAGGLAWARRSGTLAQY